MDLLGQFFWNLYVISKEFPNATGYLIGGVVGIVCMGWYLRKLVIGLFEKYLGNNKILAAKVENHEQRLLLLEQKQ